MTPIGLSGSKLISDILIDAKVPRHLRSRILVLTCHDKIAWLPGIAVDQAFAVTSNNTPAVCITISSKT